MMNTSKVGLEKREIYRFGSPQEGFLTYEAIEYNPPEMERTIAFRLIYKMDDSLKFSLTETEHLARCLLELVRIERARASEVPTDG
jgi:hypothetical protein